MIATFANQYNIRIRGILHVGANDCLEHNDYIKVTDNIVWIEANPNIVNVVKLLKPNIRIYQNLITDKDGEVYEFKISNNDGQSSSILDFNLHLKSHPSVFYIENIPMKSTTIDNFIINNNIDTSDINALVLDIQGVELRALKGGVSLLSHIDIIYTEVNIYDTYTGCDKLNDMDNFLSTFNFKRVNTHIFEGHTYGDALYIKNISI